MVEKKEACAQKKRTITTKDLPLCCPLLTERLWDGHPRVYLAVEKEGTVICPYCETEYHLQ